MSTITRSAPRVKSSPDAIDREPLSGKERADFERKVYTRATLGKQAILRQILDHCGGTAECWVSNARVAALVGCTAGYVRQVLREFETAEIVRCVVDRSLRTQRRIVVLDHPHAVSVLTRLGDKPWMNSGGDFPASKPAEIVDAGGDISVGSGGDFSVDAGGDFPSPEFSSIPKSHLGSSVSLSLPKRKNPEGPSRRTQQQLLDQIAAMQARRQSS